MEKEAIKEDLGEVGWRQKVRSKNESEGEEELFYKKSNV